MNRADVPRVKIWIAFGAIYFIWGSTYLANRIALESFGPFIMMGIRCCLAGSILYFWSRGRREKVSRPEWRSLIVIGVLFFVLGHGLLAWAQQRLASGLAALLIASEPLWMALMERVTVRNFTLQFRQIVGLLCGFLGIALLVAPVDGWNAHQTDTLPAIVILASAFFWCVGAVYSRVASIRKSSTFAASIELMIGGSILLLIALLRGEFQEVFAHGVMLRSVLALSYLVGFGSVLAFGAYVWLLSITTATRVSTHTYVNPLIALALGWALAGETISPRIFIAAGIIVVSIYLVMRRAQIKSEQQEFSMMEDSREVA